MLFKLTTLSYVKFSWWEAIHDAHSEQRNYLPHFRSWWLDFILFLIVKIILLNHGYYHFILLFFPFKHKFAKLYLQRSLTLKAIYSGHVSFLSLGPLRKESQEKILCKKYSQNTSESRAVEAEWEGQKLGKSQLRSSSLVCCCGWCWSVYPVVFVDQRSGGRAFLLAEPFTLGLSMGTTFPVGMVTVALVAWEYIY